MKKKELETDKKNKQMERGRHRCGCFRYRFVLCSQPETSVLKGAAQSLKLHPFFILITLYSTLLFRQAL